MVTDRSRTARPRRHVLGPLGTLGAGAGGLAVGGLAMALGLAVTDPQAADVRVLLDSGPGPVAGSPAASETDSGTASPPAVRPTASRAAPASARTSGPAPATTSAPGTTRRAAPAPRVVTTRARKPPVVRSTGS